MPPSCSETALTCPQQRKSSLLFSVLLAVFGLAAWASVETLTVSDAQLESLDFFDAASCDVAGPEAC